MIPQPHRPKRNRLTPREREIVDLAAQDKTDKEIAATLGISPATVNHHWRHILAKLGVHGRAAAVACLLREAAPSPKQAMGEARASR